MRRRRSCCHGVDHHEHRCGSTGFSVGDFLAAVLLEFLKSKPMHGYELCESLSRVPYYPFEHEPSVVYAVLRRLERAGFLRFEVTAGAGGLRKVYRITPEGERFLGELKRVLAQLRDSIDEFLQKPVPGS